MRHCQQPAALVGEAHWRSTDEPSDSGQTLNAHAAFLWPRHQGKACSTFVAKGATAFDDLKAVGGMTKQLNVAASWYGNLSIACSHTAGWLGVRCRVGGCGGDGVMRAREGARRRPRSRRVMIILWREKARSWAIFADASKMLLDLLARYS